MTLVQKVTRIVSERGDASVAEVAAELRGRHTTLQVKKAIYAAALKGDLVCVRGKGIGGTTGGSAPARYFPAPSPLPGVAKPEPKLMRPLASVWELATRELCDKWPLPFDGGRVYVMPQIPEDEEETA